MEITTRTVGKCKVLDCSGQLTFGTATETFSKAIRQAVLDGTLKVVLNFSDVPYIDNTGIGALIRSFVYIKKERGGSLPLLNLAPKVHKKLTIYKLLPVFDIYDDEQKAL